MAMSRQNGLVSSLQKDDFLRQINDPVHRGQSVLSASTHVTLPGVDPEKLKSRLYFCAPQQASMNAKALHFIKPTKAQLKTAAIPSAPKLEPLPGLKNYQERNQPEYIQSKARERLAKEAALDETEQPVVKKTKRSESLQPFDRPDSVTSLPELPDALKAKQDSFSGLQGSLRIPTPPYDAKRGTQTPRGKSHTTAATIPPSLQVKASSSYVGISDMQQIIKIVRENPKAGFLYLSPAVPKSSVRYHYYNLKVTEHEGTHRADHCTISQKGVVRMRNDDETEFVPLDRWEQEYNYFQKLIKIPAFSHFRKWKAFSVWQKNVKKKKVPTATLR